MRVWMSPESVLHTVPAGYPETQRRLEWAASACAAAGLVPIARSARELEEIEIEGAVARVHTDDRPGRLREAAIPWRARIDTPDCPVSPGTPAAALTAARLTLFALERARTEGGIEVVLTRPPGHHATARRAMGFCYINNIAVAARAAQASGARRVAILDFDVHHGNGTQEIFYEDGDVFFCSLHEDPRMQYPGTGFAHEHGEGAGLGATLNLPLVSGTAGDVFGRVLREEAIPALREHKAEVLLVSAGFDCHAGDPLGGLKLAGEDFHAIGRGIAALVLEEELPVVVVLEGGYMPFCFSDGLRPFLEGCRHTVAPKDLSAGPRSA